MDQNQDTSKTSIFLTDLKKPSWMGYIIYFLILCLLIVLPFIYFKYQDSNFLKFLKEYQSYMLIGLMVLFMYWIMYFLFYISPESFENNKSFFSKSFFYLGVVFFLVIVGIIIKQLFEKYILSNPLIHPYIFNDFTMIFFYSLIGMFLLAFIYKNFNLDKPTRSDGSLTALLLNTIFYIPCIIIDIVEFIKKELAMTPSSSYIILMISIMLILARVFYAQFYENIVYNNGKKLLGPSVYLNKMHFLSTMQELNYNDDTMNLEYGLLFDFSIYSFPPNINSKNDENISIFNFSDRPNVLYNLNSNKLMVTMKNENDTITTLASISNIKLQTDYNLIINYKDGTLDVFLNGKLISSTSNIIPKSDYGSITCGSNKGVPGHINSIYYFPNALGIREIEKINALRM